MVADFASLYPGLTMVATHGRRAAMPNDANIWTLLISTLLGGGILGAIVKELFARGKTRAEEHKTEAEAERIKAETKKILSELSLKQLTPVANNSSKGPMGWLKAGSDPADYDMSIDQNEIFHGHPSCTFKSCKSPRGFGTLMQMINADLYSGKRMKLTGSAKSAEVEDWAGFWMRVDGPEKPIGFDNMQDRPSSRRRLDKVSNRAGRSGCSVRIAFGLLLSGPARSGWPILLLKLCLPMFRPPIWRALRRRRFIRTDPSI
jgi:hypothetical protein